MSEALTLVSGGLMTIAEVGEYLRLQKSVLYRLMGDGTLPFTVVAGRRRRIPRNAVLQLAAAGLRGGQMAVGESGDGYGRQ